MKRNKILRRLYEEGAELQARIENCKRLGCYADEGAYTRNRDKWSLEMCTAHIQMFCSLSQINYLRRQLAKADRVQFTDGMILRLEF